MTIQPPTGPLPQLLIHPSMHLPIHRLMHPPIPSAIESIHPFIRSSVSLSAFSYRRQGKVCVSAPGQTLSSTRVQSNPREKSKRNRKSSGRHVVTSTFSQRFLHEITNSRKFSQLALAFFAFFSRFSRFFAKKLNASMFTDKLARCTIWNLDCAQGKRSLHSRGNLISTFTELYRHGDKTLTNTGDVKYIFQRSRFGAVNL